VAEVVADPSINALLIATPVTAHFDLAMKALSTGNQVLVEKPITQWLQQLCETEDLARNRNPSAMIWHTLIFR